jgi:hypothetical protein
MRQAPRSVAFVHELTPSPAVDAELSWFFNVAECEMSATSNYQAALGRHAEGTLPTADDAVEAARRHRQIRTRLKSLPDSDAGVLQAGYTLRPWPVVLYDELGRWTGVVARLACAGSPWPDDWRAQERVEMDRAEWLVSLLPTKRLDLTLARLRREAEVRYARAFRLYTQTQNRSAS